MSNSTTNLDLLQPTSASKEAMLNALFDAESGATLWGRRASTTAGLTWGYYGGYYWPPGAPSATLIANGTVTLTANATNYVCANPMTGAVTVNQTGFTAGLIPLYSVVVANGAATASSYLDCRSYQPSILGASLISVANEGASGVGLYNASTSTGLAVKLKSLLSGGVISLTNGAAAITINGAGGTVTGGSNEGAGAPVLDTTSVTPILTTKNLSGTGTLSVTDAGTEAVLSLTGAPLAVQQSGIGVVTACTVLRTGPSLTVASGGAGVANVSQSSFVGQADVVPALSGLTVVNPGAATLTSTQQNWGVQFNNPSAFLAGLTKAVPAPPYKCQIRHQSQPMAVATATSGVVLYDSVSGKWKVFAMLFTSSKPNYYVQNWTNYNTFSANAFSIACQYEWNHMRIRDDTTNWYYEVSSDGQTWATLYQEARNTFLTPNQCGLGTLAPSGFAIASTLFSMYVGA
ncbi:hypothetical protein QZM97_23715 [Burkholderia orbicola]|uniref:hypothetical protein n=1 Tax=Burkholderia orbicola TaxID=2978683 RepID=UPI00264BBBA6|nr:hypothetical protein [Burkholderia orbicola]MDN7993086.1 hypothetical protein [Burkholderia orbicola]